MAVKKKTKCYQVKNWTQYNKSLVNRGNITLWFDQELLENWQHRNETRKRGRPFTYSDAAILALLMIRELFRLPYRQTAGLGQALVKMLDVDVKIPDYSSLSKRSKKLQVDINAVTSYGKVADVVVDSTGLKVFGEGEWKVRQHGFSSRRTWRKVHIAVDPANHQIIAQAMTESGCHDGDQALDLVDQATPEIQKFYGDGAYDHWNIHEGLIEREIEPVIPPRRGSKIRQHGNRNAKPLPRDQAVRHIRRHGRAAWKDQVGYHKRSNAETAMSRLKGIFGERLKNRSFENQKTETAIRCKLLNIFALIGLPLSLWI